MSRFRRHRWPGRLALAGAGLLLLLAQNAGAAEFLDPSHALHAWLADQVRSGQMSPGEALTSALQALFAPDGLPPDLAGRNRVPLRCATALLRAVDEDGIVLTDQQRVRIEQWRRPASRALPGENLVTASGRFSIDFWTSGTDSVDVTDAAPANGIPDFVESVALALETAWSTEVTALGFDAPATAGSPYRVELRAIGGYGYVELDATAPGGTRMVLRNSFAGVPANGDPDGSEIGALRVTAAHEFRHAGQYATSGWSEPGLWVELDATWMEDQVFDQVNDYVRFLDSGSPISAPQLPLDDGGSGSYAECVFHHWIQRQLGLGALRDYWDRRRTAPGEAVLDSYEAVFAARGSSLESMFVDFARWNLQSGSRAKAGTGYPDAAVYPDARLAGTASALPAAFGSAIDHLAAKFYRVDGFSTGTEKVRLRLRRPEGFALRVDALVVRDDGARVVQPLRTASADSSFVLGTDARRIVELYLVVANGTRTAGTGWFFVDVEEFLPGAPTPMPVLSDAWTTVELATGTVRDLMVELKNTGPPGSSLEWNAWAVEPPVAAPRSVAGSTLVFDTDAYVPGEDRDYSLGILNGSTGFEYLAGVSLVLPAGVTPVWAEDFVGEFGVPLVYAGFDAGTSTMGWIDPDGGFGAVPGSSTALARVRLSFADTLTGPAPIGWTISGDGFSTAPHEVSGQLQLSGPATPRLEVLCPSPMPPGIIGQPLPLRWFAAGSDPVAVEVSHDDGQTWQVATASTPDDGLWYWPVTGPVTAQARFRIATPLGVSAASSPFEILQPVPFVSLLPASGILAGTGATGVLLRVDAAGLAPGDYPVHIDLRDANTPARSSLDVLVQVRASAVDAPVAWRDRLLGAHPNPFNPRTEIRFETSERGRVTVDLLDLRGRRIRRLLATELDAGRHAVPWDGRDGAGREVASGTYFYRVVARGQHLTGKLSLVR